MENITIRSTGKTGVRTFYASTGKDEKFVFERTGLNKFAKEFIIFYPELIEGIIMYGESGALVDLPAGLIINHMDSSIQEAFVKAIKRNFDEFLKKNYISINQTG